MEGDNRRTGRSEAAGTRIGGVLAGDLAAAQGKPAGLRLVPVPAGPRDRVLQHLIRRIGPTTAAAEVVLGQQPLFDVLIEPVQVNIGQDR